MRHLLLTVLAALIVTAGSVFSQLPVQKPAALAKGATPNTYTLSWFGVNVPTSITYFIQVSPDLLTWTYLPEIRSGANVPIAYGFNNTSSPFSGNPGRYFLRLQYTNTAIPAGFTASTADFDGDGISNGDEVGVYGTDPVIVDDTDGDGLTDGQEIAGGTNRLVVDMPAITIQYRWRHGDAWSLSPGQNRQIGSTNAPWNSVLAPDYSPTFSPITQAPAALGRARPFDFDPFPWITWAVPQEMKSHVHSCVAQSDISKPGQNVAPAGSNTADCKTLQIRLVSSRAVKFPITRRFLQAQRKQNGEAIVYEALDPPNVVRMPLTIPKLETTSSIFSRTAPSWEGLPAAATTFRKEIIFIPLAVVTINTFIPQNNVEDPRPFNSTRYKGDNRNGGTPSRALWDENGSHRTQQSFRVIADQAVDANGLVDSAFTANADGAGHNDRYVHVGETKSFEAATSLAGGILTAAALADTLTGAPQMLAKDTASQSELWIAATTYLTPKKVAVQCRCEASNPLVLGSAAISYSITITIDMALGTYSLEGTHDGFPAYEIYINGKRVYEHDPLATGDGLGSLLPDEEYNVNASTSHFNLPLP